MFKRCFKRCIVLTCNVESAQGVINALNEEFYFGTLTNYSPDFVSSNLGAAYLSGSDELVTELLEKTEEDFTERLLQLEVLVMLTKNSAATPVPRSSLTLPSCWTFDQIPLVKEAPTDKAFKVEGTSARYLVGSEILNSTDTLAGPYSDRGFYSEAPGCSLLEMAMSDMNRKFLPKKTPPPTPHRMGPISKNRPARIGHQRVSNVAFSCCLERGFSMQARSSFVANAEARRENADHLDARSDTRVASTSVVLKEPPAGFALWQRICWLFQKKVQEGTTKITEETVSGEHEHQTRRRKRVKKIMGLKMQLHIYFPLLIRPSRDRFLHPSVFPTETAVRLLKMEYWRWKREERPRHVLGPGLCGVQWGTIKCELVKVEEEIVI
eukprot:g2291.t1